MIHRVVAVLGWVALAAASVAAAEPTRGDAVGVAGRLIDAAGEPIEGAVVMFSASREHFSLRSFGTTETPPLLHPATTDVEGRFEHLWRFDGHYNRFALVVGVEVRRDGRPAFEEIARRDITEPTASGGPVAIGDWTLDNADAGYLRFLVRWVAGETGADEDKVFRDLGRPDRLTAEPDDVEAWWYFDAGKVYRFKDGTLDQVIHFDPVRE